MLFLDFYVLFHIAKVSLYFIVMKAEKLKIEKGSISKNEALIGVWAVFLILINVIMLITKAILTPLPLLSNTALGADIV